MVAAATKPAAYTSLQEWLGAHGVSPKTRARARARATDLELFHFPKRPAMQNDRDESLQSARQERRSAVFKLQQRANKSEFLRGYQKLARPNTGGPVQKLLVAIWKPVHLSIINNDIHRQLDHGMQRCAAVAAAEAAAEAYSSEAAAEAAVEAYSSAKPSATGAT